MNTLLIEIGTEEIPAGYIVPALKAFCQSMTEALKTHRIDHGTARYYGTPRRLTLVVENVADAQNPRTSTLVGPPETVGYDAGGTPTLAAEKFAAKAGIPVESLRVEDSPKGRYLVAVIEEKCESSVSLIEKILEQQILSIPFPKSMRWGDLSVFFARPIISLTGMLGDQALTFQVGNIKSGNFIYGHRFMNPGKLKLDNVDNYEHMLESASVIVDIDKRKKMLEKALETIAAENNCQLVDDPELLDIVTNLVEYPYPVTGRFDETFLQVPSEVLITAMREHQKYFALTDSDKKLAPMFIAVNNTKARDESLVARGHEKVLRARLSDAKFFWEQDKTSTLDAFAEKLKKVTFQEKLGTVHEKQQRIAQLGKYLVSASSYPAKEVLEKHVLRAAAICKADLVSQVVIEFTKLQGIIGRSYAQDANEAPDVADAVEQHYRPVYSGGELPANPCACVLALSDKLDTICGCFSVGLVPTGGADPYALRRQGIGILQIMLDQDFEFSLEHAVDNGLLPFIPDEADRKTVAGKVNEFLKNRLVNLQTEAGYAREAVNAAIAVNYDNIPDAVSRIRALDKLRQQPDFEPLAVTFKRVGNILKKTEPGSTVSINPDLFEEPAEKTLFNTCQDIQKTVESLIDKGDYDNALKNIASLRPHVDTFFDDVMVMTQNEAVKLNRIALLQNVSGLFKDIADFTKI